MRIDFLGLEAFLAIAERGSFLRASAHLNLSQTALSHRMKKFEEDLGVKLFTRSTRSLSLTPVALLLLPKLQATMEELSSSFKTLKSYAGETKKELVIGCLPTLAVHFLPRVLVSFSQKYPDIHLKIYDNSAQEIMAAVKNGEAEFALTLLSATPWDMEIRQLLKDPYLFICGLNHSLATKAGVTWGELAGERLIRISPQTGNRMVIDEALGAKRDQLNWRFEVQHVATALSMVQAGLGATVVPKSALPFNLIGCCALPLKNPHVTRSIGVMTKRGLPLSAQAEELMQMIIHALKS
jgi:DNA-binding transcriptional LysR family regulator